MSEWNNRVEAKLDTIVSDVNSMKITLASQHVVLDEHVRRTNLLEADLKPIKKHVYMVEGALKFIGLLGILAGIMEAILWMKK